MPNISGQSTDRDVPAVKGEALAQDGVGVFGVAKAKGGRGVVGVSADGTATEGKSTNGAGIWGSSTNGEGVHGQTDSPSGVNAVVGIATHPENTGNAIFGVNQGKGRGIVGVSVHATGTEGTSTNGAGVFGSSTNGLGVWGGSANAEGVHGETNSPSGAFNAVVGIAIHAENTGNGILGANNGKGRGVVGVSIHATGTEGNSTNGVGVWGTSTNGEGVHAETRSQELAALAAITMNANGSGAAVYGESRSKGPAAFFKGDVVVTGDVKLINAQDCAEDFDAIGDIEPGTVLVIDTEGTLRPSELAYDRRVAGVVSGAGDYRPGLILGRVPGENRRVPVALIGKVYCRADASYASIQVGDLLTTSPTAGYAMKVLDPAKAFGAVIGKALHGLTEGTALIPILVGLQ